MIIIEHIAKTLDEFHLGSADVTIRIDYYTKGLPRFVPDLIPQYLGKAEHRKPIMVRLNEAVVLLFHKPKRYHAPYSGRREKPKSTEAAH